MQLNYLTTGNDQFVSFIHPWNLINYSIVLISQNVIDFKKKKKTWIIDAYQPPNKLNWTELNTLSLGLSCHYTYNVLFDYRGGRRGFHHHVKLQPKIHSYTSPAPK